LTYPHYVMVVDKATRHVRLLIKYSENRTLSNENKYIRSSISTWYEYKLTYKNLQPPNHCHNNNNNNNNT